MLSKGLLRISHPYLGRHRSLFRGYFDPSYYFRLYRDEIGQTKLDPLRHFIAYGLKRNHAFSPLFWNSWYLDANPDVARSGVNPALHYLRVGWKEGRRPNPLFEPSWYRARHPDVRASGTEPLLHFLLAGWKANRSPHPLFDVGWYLMRQPDVRAAGVNPLVHFIETGGKEGRSPHPLFDTAYYLGRYPDVREAGLNPLVHFIERGLKEERQPHPLFDTPWYLAQNPDVRASGVNPLVHFLDEGWQKGRTPHPFFDLAWYRDTTPGVGASGMNPLVHFVLHGLRQGRRPNREFSLDDFLNARPEAARMDSDALVRQLASEMQEQVASSVSPAPGAGGMREAHFLGLRTLNLLNVASSTRRLSIITDSLDDGYMFGGLATSLIIATKLAVASGRGLRIVTRHSFPNADNYFMLLKAYGLPKPVSLELFSDFDRMKSSRYRLDVSRDEVFITTSWWSTYCLLSSGYRGKVFYIIQECETMFYPNGDEQLLARKTISDPSLHFMVNSRLLFDHLVETEGYGRVRDAGVFFEPAFPEDCFSASPSAFSEKEKHRLFFYARPPNLRNLFHTGAAILDDAIRHGLLDPGSVEVCFAGAHIEQFEFSDGYRPTLLGKMTWTQYLEFVKTVDLGFSLMYTPHPSYPPLDVAASGGVALTNAFGSKTSLDAYSRNIVCFDLMSRTGARDGLGAALELMRDGKRRKTQYQESRLSRDWGTSLRDVVQFFLDNTDRGVADRAIQ